MGRNRTTAVLMFMFVYLTGLGLAARPSAANDDSSELSASTRQESLEDVRLLAAEQANFAGAHFDHSTSEQVFQFVGYQPDPRSKIVAAGPPGVAIRFEDVTRSLADLQAISGRLQDERTALLARGIDIASWGVDPRTNSVLVGLRGGSAEAEAELTSIFGRGLTFRRHPESKLDACNNRFDCWPMKGGLAISRTGVVCTSGFVAKRVNINPIRYYMLTAGHCIASTPYVPWKHASIQFGTAGPDSWDPMALGDAGLILFDDPDIPTLKNQFLANDTPTNDIRSLTSVIPLTSQQVGDYICRFGRTTGKLCGFIYLANVTRDVDGYLIQHSWEVDFDADIGDSGAPMFLNVGAYGVQTDSEDGFVVTHHGWYTPIYWGQQALQQEGIYFNVCISAGC